MQLGRSGPLFGVTERAFIGRMLCTTKDLSVTTCRIEYEQTNMIEVAALSKPFQHDGHLKLCMKK